MELIAENATRLLINGNTIEIFPYYGYEKLICFQLQEIEG